MGCGSSNAAALPTVESLEERNNPRHPTKTERLDSKLIVQMLAEKKMTLEPVPEPETNRGTFVRIMSERRMSDTSSVHHRNTVESVGGRPILKRGISERRSSAGQRYVLNQDSFELMTEEGRKESYSKLRSTSSVDKVFDSVAGTGGTDEKEEPVPMSVLMTLFSMKESDMCSSHILSYLSLNELSIFDMCATNHEIRPGLLRALKRLHIVNVPSSRFITNTLVKWMTSRDLFIAGSVFLHPWEHDDTSKHVGHRCSPTAVHTVSLKRGNIVSSLTGKGIWNIIHRCPCLNSLDLTHCRAVVDTDITTLSTCCPNLEHLNLSGCVSITDRAVSIICDAYPEIVYLNLSFCRKLTDTSLEIIGDGGLGELRSLSLQECRKISNEGIGLLARGCGDLSVINLSWCGKLSDEALEALADGCKKLLALSLVGLRHIKDSGLCTMLEANPQLRALDIRKCAGITDTTPATLARCSPKLEQLYLSECRALTDETVAALAYGCSELTTLFVSECALLTDLGIEALPYGCSKLTTLDVSYCPNIHSNTVESLMTEYPSLCIYYSCFHTPDEPPDLLVI